MRERRVANERRLLDLLAAENPEGLTLAGWESREGGDIARVALLDTPAYRIGGGIVRRHEVRLVLPEYFPSVPIEAYLEVPVAHANVHPVNGFVCLWDRHAKGDTVIEALRQLQRIITWQLWNSNPNHNMQPDLGECAPLPYRELAAPASYTRDRAPAAPRRPRQRLTPAED